MNKVKQTNNNYDFFLNFSLFWVVFGFLALILTLLDFFYSWVLILYLVSAGIFFAFRIIPEQKKIKLNFKISPAYIAISLAFFAFVFIFSFFTTATIFTGRDQGSLSIAAIELAKNHQLTFSDPASVEFFKIYGEGKALNFPGFHYTEDGQLTTQFPLGYISWLAAFYSFFGINGLIIANAAALFLFLSAFYLLGKKLLKKNYALILPLFTLSSFSFIWFFKFTLSENLALALLWIYILNLVEISEKPDRKKFLALILSASLLAFTRIEGFAFLVTGGLILFFNPTSRQFLQKNIRFLNILILSLFFIFLFYLQKDWAFFKEILKATFNSFFEINSNGKIITKNLFFPGFRMIQIYTLYGLISFWILGLFGVIAAFFKKNWQLLIPFFLASPSLIYLVNSSISSDHPWMLRRFVFSILPLSIFYSAVFLKYLLAKKIDTNRRSNFWLFLPVALIILIIFINLKPFLRFAFFSENEDLLQQTQELAKRFSSNDLILVDRLSSGDGWSLLAGPLNSVFNLNAVYFFNPNDLDKLDLDQFENVYILVGQKEISNYLNTSLGEKLTVADKYTLKTTRLTETSNKNSTSIIDYPQKSLIKVSGYILKLTR